MLSGLLKSDIAAEVNIKVINAFVTLRKYVSSNLIEQKYINNLVLDHEEKNNHIFFEVQIYDAYSIMLDILSKTNKRITLITNKYNNEDYNKYKEQYSNIDLVINNKIHDCLLLLIKKFYIIVVQVLKI